jgi:hypothetical protein
MSARSLVARVFGLLVAMACLFAVRAAPAAPHGYFNRPEDEWHVAETRYFRIYFTEDTPNTAARLAAIADATFERLNAFYGYALPDKIGVSVVGYTGYSNGFAEYGRRRITIYATPANFHSRSRVDWLESVFTHELSHVLSLNAGTSPSSHVPILLGTGVARADSAQGLLQVPIYTENFPRWFSEGIAQFDTSLLGRDAFDENRAAYERAGIEDGLYYELDRLSFYGEERWYNTGFSFLIHLEQRFGRGSVHRLFARAGRDYHYVFETLFEDVLGVPLAELERDFRAEVKRRFDAHVVKAHGGAHDGTPLLGEDETVPYRTLAPAERDYLEDRYARRPMRYLDGQLFYRQGDEIRRARIAPDGRRLISDEVLFPGIALAPHTKGRYFVLRQDGHAPSVIPSIYRPGFESASLYSVRADGEEQLLLAESRLTDLDVCPGRQELAGVYNDGDGSLLLALLPIGDFSSGHPSIRLESARFPLRPQAFDEVRSPRYSPDCKWLFFSRRVGDDHDVHYLDLETGRVHAFAAEDAFELYPEPVADGAYFVSARDGTMSVYFKRYDSPAVSRITEAVTAHHYPVATPHGLAVSRLTGTAFQAFLVATPRAVATPIPPLSPKPNATLRTRPRALARTRPYRAFSPADLTAPTLVPVLGFSYEVEPNATFEANAGLDVFFEDQLRTHALWLRAVLGGASNLLVDYSNSMSELRLRGRVGYTQGRALYTFDRNDGQSFDHLLDYRWGYLYGSASTALNLFFTASLDAETLRDIGTTFGSRPRTFDFGNPRYGRDRVGASIAYSGIDRSNPTFRERLINRRGYRDIDLSVSYAVEEVDATLGGAGDGSSGERASYVRAELTHIDRIALPALLNGFFDHTLELSLKLGYISRDIRFLPFSGGGQLVAQTTPELNASIGFAGYRPFSVYGETLASLGASYRFPLLRGLGWDAGPLFLDDVYAQLFTSWGNIWGYDANGERQWPVADAAPNGRYVLGDFGVDLRLLTFFQGQETNVGTTFRAVYRAIPFASCPDPASAADPECLRINGEVGPMFYVMLGAGF